MNRMSLIVVGIIAGVVLAVSIPAAAFISGKRWSGNHTFDKINAKNSLEIAGTAVTSTAAELNYVDVTAGTLTASKALVADSSSQLDDVDVTGGYKIDGQYGLAAADVTISGAELQALNTTPQTVVSAPGANLAVIFDGAMLEYDYNSTACTGVAAGEDLVFAYTDETGDQVSVQIETTGMIDQTNDEVRWAGSTAVDQAAVGDIIPVANADVVLALLSGDVADCDSPLDVKVYYRVVPTALP